MVIDPSFWRGRRVFLTGHTGFKGGWLTHWLKAMGASVVGYSLDPPSAPSLFEAADIGDAMTDLRGDIRDAASLTDAVRRSEPEFVFHLAAQPIVRSSYGEPVETFATNIMGTVNLFEAVRLTPTVRVVLNVTSDKCYLNREWLWPYRENEPLGGHDPYSASKAAAEIVTSSYRDSFFAPEGRVRLATGRAGNVIGGGDWATDRIIPDLMRAFSAGSDALIRNPGAIRPWQHVLDALCGYLRLAQALADEDGARHADAWNFGPDPTSESTVGDMVPIAMAAWGDGARVTRAARPSGPHEATFLRLDSTKARTQLGWRPVWGLEDAVRETVRWYRAYYSGGPVRDLMDEQTGVFTAQG